MTGKDWFFLFVCVLLSPIMLVTFVVGMVEHAAKMGWRFSREFIEWITASN